VFKKAFNEDLLLTPAMRQRFDIEAVFEQDADTFIAQQSGIVVPMGAGGWWAAVQRTNGEIHRFTNGRLLLDPTADQTIWQLDVLKILNHEIPHDGAWVVGWTHGNTRAIWLWLDQDGDVQFTVDNEESWETQAGTEMLHWIEQCEQGWSYWFHYMREVLDPNPDTLFKRAQGQKPPSQQH